MNKVEEQAKLVDHSILQPSNSDGDPEIQCEVAGKYNVASLCVKLYAVKKAAIFMRDGKVKPGCVIRFPHVESSTRVKAFEAEKA